MIALHIIRSNRKMQYSPAYSSYAVPRNIHGLQQAFPCDAMYASKAAEFELH